MLKNLHHYIPLIAKATGIDVRQEAELFYRARAAVGTSLSPKGQEFVMNNWRGFVDFMETPAGQAAIVDMVAAWGQSLAPKITAPPTEPGETKPEESSIIIPS